MTYQVQNVLVTGAGQSAGRAMAEAFHARGDRVHICDLDPERVKAVLDANPGMRGSAADVGSAESVEQLFAEAFDWLGHVDVLVNTVGISGPRARIEEMPIDEWQQTMVVNVDSMFFTIRKAVPGMRKNHHGAIVNFSTGSTKTVMPFRTPYVASKAAVEGLTRCLARELGPDNIRINAILPGMIDNERMRGIVARIAEQEGRGADEVEADFLRYISMRTKIAPQEFADMVLFLCSDAAKHVTGQLIGLDGNIEWEL